MLCLRWMILVLASLFSDDDLDDETKKWQHSLVIFVVGAVHTLSYMEQFVKKAWGAIATPVLHQYI